MNNLAIQESKTLSLFTDNEQLKKVKEIYCKNLSNDEFNIFCEIGIKTGLNPFMREIWAVKYKDSPAQIFIGRDGYRKAAQEDPEYDFHHVDAVYEKDKFSYNYSSGEINHEYGNGGRGKVIGAFCVVKRKSASKLIYVYCDFNEYLIDNPKTLWFKKPATMIKKVAESQALRMAFQGKLAGTYSEEEKWKDDPNYEKPIHEGGAEVLQKKRVPHVEPKQEFDPPSDSAILLGDELSSCANKDEFVIATEKIKSCELSESDKAYLRGVATSVLRRVTNTV